MMSRTASAAATYVQNRTAKRISRLWRSTCCERHLHDESRRTLDQDAADATSSTLGFVSDGGQARTYTDDLKKLTASLQASFKDTYMTCK